MHVESESKIKLETGVEITKAANGSAPDPKNLRYYGSGQLRQYGSNRKRLERPKRKNCYTKLMEGRVVVNILLDGFKNFGKHPVGIDVKPGFKRYLTKFFLSTTSATACRLRNDYAARRHLKTSKDACFL